MNTSEYAVKYRWEWIKETEDLWYQCVASSKHAIKQIFNIQLGRFWGTARTGWDNVENTFPEHTWDRIVNDFNNPDQTPLPGDVIFFDTPSSMDHVATVLKAPKWENKITVIEQNVWNGDGEWEDDKTQVNDKTYNTCLGWYSYKMNMDSFRGVKVKYSDATTQKENVAGQYYKTYKLIILTSLFYKLPREDQEGVIMHEYWHHIYHTMPASYRALWFLMWSFDDKILKKLKNFGMIFTENTYVSNYAKTNASEWFSENIRIKYLEENIEWKWAKLKNRFAVYMFNKIDTYENL